MTDAQTPHCSVHDDYKSACGGCCERLFQAFKAKDDTIEELVGALEPFAEYHRERHRLHPNMAKEDSTIPVCTYGTASIGDKHFRAAAEALAFHGTGELARLRGFVRLYGLCKYHGGGRRDSDIALPQPRVGHNYTCIDARAALGEE